MFVAFWQWVVIPLVILLTIGFAARRLLRKATT
jgi:hypothetical protein